MSSLSLAVPGACPALFSPSLSVLLDSVSTSWGQEQLLERPQACLCPRIMVLSSSSAPLLQETLRKGIPPPDTTSHSQCLEHLWDFGELLSSA